MRDVDEQIVISRDSLWLVNMLVSLNSLKPSDAYMRQ